MRRIGRLIFCTLLLAAGSDAGFAREPKIIAPIAGKACELHVWGSGRPNFVPRSNFMVKITPDPDPTNPLSNTQLYNTVNRVSAFADEDLLTLFPDAETVTIIRHADMIDTDKTPIKAIHARLAPSTADCYGDLIATNVTSIFPNPDFQGLLVEAIKGGNRLIIEFVFQRFDGNAAKPQLFKRRNDAPVVSFRAPREDYAASIKEASTAILRSFAETVKAQMAKG